MKNLKYIFSLLALCLFLKDTSAQYCDARATETGTDYIKMVSLEAINNESGADGYADYTNECTAKLYIGGSYTLKAVNASHHTTNKFGLWIDWNADNDFEDEGEQIEMVYPSKNLEMPGVATFEVPEGAIVGNTRMRIVLTEMDEPQACGDFYYGEVEDYAIYIGASNVAPEADFVVDRERPFINTPVRFTDLSSALPSTYEWSFSPNTVTFLNDTDANSPDPVVEFDEGTVYSVTLKVTNAHGEDELVKTNYIDVLKFNPPFNLSATTEGNWVDLSWNAPIYESFEFYDDFALEIAPWTQFDGDSRPTLEFTSLNFPNMGYTGSFIVMNPTKTTPNLVDSDPVSGSRYLCCFRNDGDFNNDWLISPQFTVENNETMSFFAKTISAAYSLDKFRVLVSTTDNDPESFEIISGKHDVTAPLDWTKYAYDLSDYQGQQIYVAIQCVSSYALALCIDDISITQGNGEVKFKNDFEAKYLTGFQVFRDDEMVGMINNSYETSFRDTDVPDGDHTYNIVAVYVSPDCESAYSEPCSITVNNSAPELAVFMNEEQLENEEQYTVKGYTPEGESQEIHFQIANTGNATALEINNFTIEGEDFSLVQGPPAIIDYEESAEVIVKYTPTNQGSDVLNIHFESNDANEGEFGFQLKATTGAIWTWMIYLYEDGTGLNGFKDINELEVNGSVPDMVQYVVLYDSDVDANDGIYLIQKDPDGSNSNMISECIDKSMGLDPNMNSYQTLEKFMLWTAENYPANNYALTVWDHGSGIFKKDNSRAAVGEMKLWEMEMALNSFVDATQKKLEIMSFDVCLLGQVETAYQLKDCAKYMIASEKTEPADGYDYYNAFKDLNADPYMSTEQITKNVVEAYYESYLNGTQVEDSYGTTQSSTNIEAVQNQIVPALDVFAEALIEACYEKKEQIKESRNMTWYSDGIDDHIDLGHFAKNIKQNMDLPEDLRTKAELLMDAIDEAVILHRYTRDVNAATTGLKIWFPKFVSTEAEYVYYKEDNLQYLTFGSTKWDEFLEAFENPSAPGVPFAKFEAGSKKVKMMKKTFLRDLSSSNPIITSREWVFEPAENVVFTDGTNANSKAPAFYFTRPGNYNVTLIVSNSVGEKTLKKVDVFEVDIPNVIAPILDGSVDGNNVTLSWKGSQDLNKTFFEDFEDPENLVWSIKTSSSFNYSQTVVPASNAKNWTIIDENTFNGDGSQYIHSGNYAAGLGYDCPNFSWLISPEMTIQENDDLSFYVWYKNGEEAGNGTVYYSHFYVAVIDDNKAYKILEWTSQSTPSNLMESPILLDLHDFEGKEVNIAFVYEYSDGFQMSLDDICVGEADSKDSKLNNFTTKGFNIYRNDDLLAEITDPSQRTYTDELEENANYSYTIREVYEDPAFESQASNAYTVNLVGLQQLMDERLSVFPVPAKDYVTVELPEGGEYSIELLSPQGLGFLQINDISGNSYKMDVQSVPAGAYVVRVSDGYHVWVRKITVQ